MILYGASGHGKVVFSICPSEVKCFIDDNERLSQFQGRPVLRYADAENLDDKVVITIGNNKLRRKIASSTIQPLSA